MINIDTHFLPEAYHVDFMTTIKEPSWFANTTNHDAFQTVSNLLCPGSKHIGASVSSLYLLEKKKNTN